MKSIAQNVPTSHESVEKMYVLQILLMEKIGTNGLYTLQPFLQRRTRSDNIIYHLPGVVGTAKTMTFLVILLIYGRYSMICLKKLQIIQM